MNKNRAGIIATILLATFVTTVADAQIQAPVQQIDQSALTEEIVILKAQLALQEKFQDRLLNTVYWSLGIVFTIAIGIVGFGWIANFRNYERDKEAIRESLHGTIDRRLADSQLGLQTAINTGLDAAKEAATTSAINAVNSLRGCFEKG